MTTGEAIASIIALTALAATVGQLWLAAVSPDRIPRWIPISLSATFLACIFAAIFIALNKWASGYELAVIPAYLLTFAVFVFVDTFQRFPNSQTTEEVKSVAGVSYVWFQHAAFYVAFAYWPDPDLPVFGNHGEQVPGRENRKLIYALKDMHQKALSGELTVLGKTPLTPIGPSINSLFDEIPRSHWRDHRVEYMDLITYDDPSTVMTTKDTIHQTKSWCALQVIRRDVEELWPSKDYKINFQELDKREAFELYEAACMFFDVEPCLPMPSLSQNLYDEWRQDWLIKRKDHLVIEISTADAAKSGVEIALGKADETFNPHMIASREALINWCDTHAMRPRFLFKFRKREAR